MRISGEVVYAIGASSGGGGWGRGPLPATSQSSKRGHRIFSFKVPSELECRIVLLMVQLFFRFLLGGGGANRITALR